MKRVIHINYYDHLNAKIEVGRMDTSDDAAAAASCEGTIIILRENHIVLLQGDQQKIITDEQRELYSFEIVTKVTPPPIDPSLLSQKEILALLENPDYMLSEEDIQKVPWTISEAHQYLKKLKPARVEFGLSSAAYRVETIGKPGAVANTAIG